MKSFKIIVMVSIITVCLMGCQKDSFDAEYQTFKDTMADLSQQDMMYVSLQIDNKIDGVSYDGVRHEIWKYHDHAAMTTHLPDKEQNTLYYEGLHYVQREENGKYEITGESYMMPDLWAGVLNTAKFEEFHSAELQHTDNGKILTVRIHLEDEQKTEITATLVIDADDKVSSITTVATWNQTVDGVTHAIVTTQTTTFISYEEDIAQIISDRAEKISK